MTPENDAAARYFSAITAALSGLEVFMRDDRSPLYRHDIVARIMAGHIARLERSFSSWRNRLGFMEKFRISRAESGFPAFQNVLELHEKNMVASGDIQRRKKLADDAFARRFEEVMRKHNAADYVRSA